MSSPNVSIIVPCYGVEKYLDRCMEKILAQSLQNIEIVLVDDQSPDRVPEMCDEYKGTDSRIKVVHRKNGGLGYARNSGIEIATGEYVAFLDSDDFVDEDMFNKLYVFAKEHNLDVAFCGFNYFEGESVIGSRTETEKPVVFNGDDVKNIVLKGMMSSKSRTCITDYEMSVWHGIYKKQILEDNNIWFVSERELISEDIIFHIDYLSKARKVGFIPDCLYYYCVNPVSLTKVYKADRFDKECILFQEILRRLETNGIYWKLEDVAPYYALKIRFVITSCVNHIGQVGKKIIKNEFNRFARNECLYKWVYPFYMRYPKRYKLFYFLLRFRLVNLLFLLLKRRNDKR